MPPVNIYYQNRNHEPEIIAAIDLLRDFVAAELSTEQRRLRRGEVSARAIHCLGSGMLADIEIDITAATHPDRVARQDDICSNVQAFMRGLTPSADGVKVWLALPELGYSFDSED